MQMSISCKDLYIKVSCLNISNTHFRQFSKIALLGYDKVDIRDPLGSELNHTIHRKYKSWGIIKVLQTTIYSLVNTDEDFSDAIFAATVFFVVIVYSTYLYSNWEKDKLSFDQCCDQVGSFIFLSMMLAFLTPVLQSFATIWATDSTIFIALLLIACHLVAYDYHYVIKISQKENALVVSPTSLNAMFMASILLASRIQKIRSVFILLFLSLILFGFGPFIRRMIRHNSRLKYDLMGVVGIIINFVVIFKNHHLMAFVYLSFALFLTCGTPVVFIYAYRFKNDIRGPWDLPQVKQYTTLAHS